MGIVRVNRQVAVVLKDAVVTFLQTVVRSDSQALAWNEVRSLAAAQRPEVQEHRSRVHE